MLMGNRELGLHDESKDFTDKLGPLRRWLESQVGRNWDRIYSEIKAVFPNTNKQNHHLIETHLLHEVEHNVFVEKSGKGRRVYTVPRYGFGRRELLAGDIYVDPQTHVLMRYKRRPPSSPLPVAPAAISPRPEGAGPV
jgi:NADPH-dependent ferric siderophore reductase